jgi:hypothetical protein
MAANVSLQLGEVPGCCMLLLLLQCRGPSAASWAVQQRGQQPIHAHKAQLDHFIISKLIECEHLPNRRSTTAS